MMSRIKDAFSALKEHPGKVALFVIGWIIAFDTLAGTFIPIAYGNGCGWFAIPNLIIDIYVIVVFVRRLKDEGIN